MASAWVVRGHDTSGDKEKHSACRGDIILNA